MQSHDEETTTWANPAATPQPPPQPGQTDVLPLVLADLEARSRMGLAKYSRPLQVENGRNGLTDALQEHYDLIMYLRQALEQHKALLALLTRWVDWAESETDGDAWYPRALVQETQRVLGEGKG